jgi:hypothetical protein
MNSRLEASALLKEKAVAHTYKASGPASKPRDSEIRRWNDKVKNE